MLDIIENAYLPQMKIFSFRYNVKIKSELHTDTVIVLFQDKHS